jgi:RNA polymerase sigma-70 factor (ECF subfamily)
VLTDAELVEGIRRGSRESAGLLIERYLRACRAVALAITGEISGAEDVCQDAFIYLIERIDDVQQPDRVSSWLFQIVRNRARNHVRDLNSERTIEIDLEAVPGNAPSPALSAERSEMRDRLLAALAQLPEERREIVLLHDLEGWTHEEIAARLEMPAGTVRSHLHHARRALREILGDVEVIEQ